MKNKMKLHALFTHSQDIIEICKPLKIIGIQGFIYMCHYPDGSFLDLSNQLEWSEYFLSRYLSEKYSLNDLKKHMLIKEGVNLWILNMDNLIWQEGMQYFNFGNGITFCKSYKNYKEIVSFYTNKDMVSMNDFYLNHIDNLIAFVNYFKEKAKGIIRKGEHDRLYTPKIYFADPEQKIRNTLQEQNKMVTDKFLSQIGRSSILETELSENHLTNRELACIQACTEGKSAQETADILFLSRRTVEEHLSNAKRKLNCQNISQLIFKASRLFPLELM